MKRLHVSLAVKELEPSIAFYATLFGSAPTVLEPGYAKWMLDDPRVNFVLDARGTDRGVDHFGIQVDSPEAVAEVAARLHEAGRKTTDQTGAHCCFARSDKSWVADPQGLMWETFFTHGLETTYGPDSVKRETLVAGAAESCCATADSCCAG